MLNSEARICIVGAGAAGLSAAWYLRKRGYRRITILEKSARVGGKCLSLEREGAVLELGAVLLMPNYRHVIAVASELGMIISETPPFEAVRRRGDGVAAASVPRLISENYRISDLLGTVCRLLWVYCRHSAVLGRPGFAGMSARSRHGDLAKPFAEWAAARRIAPLKFQWIFDAFGYGDVRPLPAGYVLRYVSAGFYIGLIRSQLHHLMKGWGLGRFTKGWPQRLDRGFGELTRRMARGFDIRTGARIEAIHRDGAVTVCWSEPATGGTQRREESFDRLILACPPAATANAMDWSAAEARLFGLVRTLNYAVTVCETTGIPPAIQFFETPHKPGDLSGLWKPAETNACVFYSDGVDGETAEAVVDRLRMQVARIHPGATLGRIIEHVSWPYFPQVDTEAFGNGFFDDFEALQGLHATWYCGALLAFESVENVFAYSKALVERMVTSCPDAGALA